MYIFSRNFLVAGILFIILGIVADKTIIFLPIGIASIILGILGMWRSRKLNAKNKD